MEIQKAVLGALRHIPPEIRALEPELYLSRWWDYRMELPARATELFMLAYERAYRDQYAKVQDAVTAPTVPVFGVTELFASGGLMHFWRARQEADRLCCRYDYYLRFAFNRAFERGSRYLLRPNQILSEELSLDLEVAWLETKRLTLQLATHPIYLPGNYCGMPEQDDYFLYLVGQIQRRSVQDRLLARLVFKDRLIPAEIAAQHFDAEVLERASFIQNC
ncbi:hypothetical protein [Castellaniella sp.]|uniref:hypothetical protein n=1 Tax=Castellaniella sp. TaxID=1955812 RepID=UPI002AFE2B5E|nr:hypothetical protein [Castellaniella sp.]